MGPNGEFFRMMNTGWSYLCFVTNLRLFIFFRIAWGCLCESLKVVEHARIAYMKKKTELEEKIEKHLEAEKIKGELPDITSLGIDDEDLSDADAKGTIIDEERERHASSEAKGKLSSELYNNERKWREMQLVYASVLKVIT